MVKKLLIKRKGFSVVKDVKPGRGVVLKRVNVPPTSFLIKDRGKPGRSNKVLPKLKKATLDGRGFFSKGTPTRRKTLVDIAKVRGEKVVIGKLRTAHILSRNINPSTSSKAKTDARFIASSFIGNKRVKTGTGLSQ